MSVTISPPAQPVALSRRDAARRYGVSLRTFQRRVAEGVLPAPVFLGDRSPRWWVRDLDAAVAAATRKPAASPRS